MECTLYKNSLGLQSLPHNAPLLASNEPSSSTPLSQNDPNIDPALYEESAQPQGPALSSPSDQPLGTPCPPNPPQEPGDNE